MQTAPSLQPFLLTLLLLLPAAAGGGAWYISQQNIPLGSALGVLAALLIEVSLFLSTGSAAVRERLSRLPPERLAQLLTLLTAATWVLAGGRTGWQGLAATAAAALLAYWYLEAPSRWWTDFAILAFYGMLTLGKASGILYDSPWPKAPAAIVGELAWLRTLVFATLIFRRPLAIGYGFLPTAAEWRSGARWFLYFIPVALALGWAIGFARPRPLPANSGMLALLLAGTFIGHFLFVALREEFLFRGMLLPALQQRMGPMTGLAFSCAVFGSVHLPFGHFPNWRFAAVATAAGWFYTRSYQATGSIRSAMVTHALTNVIARVFLST